MKKKNAINIILALLMIVSTISVGTAKINANCIPEITVEKEVYDGEDYVDEVEAAISDILTFRITVSYHSNCGNSYMHTNISVKDTLPDCLEFSDNVLIEYGSETYSGTTDELGKTIYWNLTDSENTWLDQDIKLWDTSMYPEKQDTVTIYFDAEVVDYTDSDGEDNLVDVKAWETCCKQHVYGEDIATVIVNEPENPDISIDKKVRNPVTDEWEDGPLNIYYSDLGDPAYLEFKINVTNTGNVDLEHVVVTDVLPDFLTYHDSSYTPSSIDGQNITWGPFNLPKGAKKICYLMVEVDTSNKKEIITGENFVNVTAVEKGCICNCECLYDEDTVEITIKYHIIVEKKVWNGSAWADKIDYVSKSENIEFKITTTYYGKRTMKCLLVMDDLPECLSYVETISIKVAGEEISLEDIEIKIGKGETVEICEQEFILEEGFIIWDWTNATLALQNGETVEIIFETEVTEYCPGCGCIECQQRCWDQNCAMAVLWGCCPCDHFMDNDCVDVLCCPPPTTFEKKGREKGENNWEDTVETTVGEEVEFKLELEYYGEKNLTDISFKDEIPCILEYDNNVNWDVTLGDATLDTTEISSDGKTIWFNFTGDLEDSGTITITFDAIVIGSTGDCEECELSCYNYASVIGYTDECPPKKLFLDDTVDIEAESNCPPQIHGISGPSSGKVDEELSFTTTITDPDGDEIYYKINVDGEETNWLGPINSGDEVTYKHTFDEEGTYTIKVKAKDEHGLEIDWDESLDIDITEEKVRSKVLTFLQLIKNTPLYNLITSILERLPALQKIIQI